MPTFILYETAMGYALFKRKTSEEVAVKQIQKHMSDFKYVSDMLAYVSFVPFESPEHGLDNMNSISEGVLHEFLSQFLSENVKKEKKSKLGVSDLKLASAIQESLEIECFSDDTIQQLVRAIRFHFDKFLKEVKQSDIEKAQLGLGHAYSRAKVKFNINKADNMITQAISMLDQLDKDMNTFTMRLREWYAWHFPELNKIVRDNLMFAKLVKLIKDKSSVNSESEHAITEVTGDEALSQEIVSAAKSSMGLDLAEFDMINIEAFSDKVISLGEYRKQLFVYLQDKMHTVAPNLTVLLGEQVGARLISHAGSLMSLSKYPASTVQILGAEKALFRALKTKGKTPKYGLLYHSSFIGRASKQNKGRISRYLANKCSIAVRMDAFQDFPTTKYGEELKDQVEQRLAYYEANGQGVTMKKNVEVMKTVKTKLKDDIAAFEADKKKPVVSNKRKREQEDEAVEEEQPKKKSKKEKKEKKEKKSKKQEDEAQPEEQAPEEDAEPPKKKQKLSKEEKKLRKDKKKKAAVAEEDE